MGLTREESYLAKVIAAKISGFFSMIGSGLIIRDVILRWRRRKEKQFLPIVPRMILSMSVADFFTSFFVHFIGTWMVQKGDVTILDETFPIPLATGNDTTCKIQAFIWSLFTLAGISTNATLATAYWLLVCKEKKEIELYKWKWQIPLLWFPWLIGVADSFIFMIGFGFYGHNNAWFCGSFLSVESPHRDWRNGELAAIVGVINILIISMMAMLIKFVHTLEKKSDTYRRNGETRQNTIQVTHQGIFFILSYMAAMIPAIIPIIINALPEPYIIFVSCIHPLQGAFNALVYFRPKYIAERQKMASRSNLRASRLSSILITLNVSLPRRLSALSSGGRNIPPQFVDEEVTTKTNEREVKIHSINVVEDAFDENELR
ncbi:hypothetical protein ACHAXS_001189 [Conticribra weissflogii]